MKSKSLFICSAMFCALTLFQVGCGNEKSHSAPVKTADSPSDSDGDVESDSDEIVRGQPIKSKEEISKSIVAVLFQRAEGQGLCTGTLISNDLVLTAAHCVDGNPQQIAIVFAPKVQGVNASQFIRGDIFTQNNLWKHPTQKGHGDLALIHFNGAIPNGYQPTNLADKKLDLPQGTKVLLAGYGVTDGTRESGSGVLRETNTTVVGENSPTEIVTDGRQTSVCFGDSGGPGFVQIKNEFVQWGVASSVSNHECNGYSVHTGVMAFRSWIKTAAGKLRKKARTHTPSKQSTRNNAEFTEPIEFLEIE